MPAAMQRATALSKDGTPLQHRSQRAPAGARPTRARGWGFMAVQAVLYYLVRRRRSCSARAALLHAHACKMSDARFGRR